MNREEAAWAHLLKKAWTGSPEERADANRRMDNLMRLYGVEPPPDLGPAATSRRP